MFLKDARFLLDSLCLQTDEPLNIDGAHGAVGDEEENDTKAVINSKEEQSNKFIPGQEPTDDTNIWMCIFESNSLVLSKFSYELSWYPSQLK